MKLENKIKQLEKQVEEQLQRIQELEVLCVNIDPLARAVIDAARRRVYADRRGGLVDERELSRVVEAYDKRG